MTYVPPPDDVIRCRVAAYHEVERRLGPYLVSGGLRVSPLGPGHSSDVDAHVSRAPDPAELERAGWLPLDRLLKAVGIDETGRWAVVVDGRVVGAADIHLTAPPDPVEHVLDRCRRQGAGPRELAELEALRAQGHHVAPVPPRRRTAPLRRVVAAVRRALRPRVVVAISGVDGAGKSTLSTRLVEDLGRAGVPATRIWVRPGVTSGPVARLTRIVKRLLREDPKPGLRQAAKGRADAVRSRRGWFGVLWSQVIIANFAVELLRRYAAARGVAVFDRHQIDAEVTLRVLYPVGHELSWKLARRVIPAADLRFHLSVPAEVAVSRKPEDPIGEWAVEQQLQEYAEVLEEDVITLDGRDDPDRLAMHVLQVLTGRAP